MVEQHDQLDGGSTQPAQGGQQLPSIDDLKTQAAKAAENARSSLNALAAEARTKVNEVVEQQKTAGADHLSGLAHAAQSAASDLQKRSPAAAQLVRDAASTVDRFAGDLRSSDVRDLVASVTTLARQQPVAFFAGSVLLGLAFARFFKSEMPAGVAPRRSASGEASGYQSWSAAHSEDGNV